MLFWDLDYIGLRLGLLPQLVWCPAYNEAAYTLPGHALYIALPAVCTALYS